MKNKLLPQLGKFCQKLNQRIKKVSQTRHWHKRKIFNFLLCLTLGVIITSIGITTRDWATTGKSALTYKTSWIGNTFGGGNLRVQNNIEAMYVAD